MKIFAIEDEPTILKSLTRHILEVLPEAEVYAFDNTDDVIKALGQSSVDLAFLDIELGYMNGVELAKRIKAKYPHCDIVFCTGYSNYATQAFELAASDYLLKPITSEKIKHALLQLRHTPQLQIPVEKLFIRCFGTFEIFYNGAPLASISKGAKELLAYLIDKAGEISTSADIVEAIFPNNAESYLRVAKMDLEKALAEIGEEDILVKGWGKLGIQKDKILCDYFEYIDGNPSSMNLFTGAYMTQYDWAKSRISELTK